MVTDNRTLRALPQADRIWDLLDYDPNSGVCTWRVDHNNGQSREGDIAGTMSGSGYYQISIDGCKYMLHRVIWLWMTGEEPHGVINHEDHAHANNKWNNLRVVRLNDQRFLC